jgi:hypothetical protein
MNDFLKSLQDLGFSFKPIEGGFRVWYGVKKIGVITFEYDNRYTVIIDYTVYQSIDKNKVSEILADNIL